MAEATAPKVYKWYQLEPILKPLRRRVSPSSWVSDFISLRKSLLLCNYCAYKVDPKRFEYRELTIYHGYGICDQRAPGCAVEGPASLWLWEGSLSWQESIALMDRVKRG